MRQASQHRRDGGAGRDVKAASGPAADARGGGGDLPEVMRSAAKGGMAWMQAVADIIVAERCGACSKLGRLDSVTDGRCVHGYLRTEHTRLFSGKQW